MTHLTRKPVRTWKRLAVAAVSTAVLVGSLAPAFAADKKKPDKDQGDAARDVLDKQKDIAKALKDKKQDSDKDSTDALQKQLDGLKADLAAETTRHTQAAADLQADLKAATDGGDKKKIAKAEKAAKKEDDAFGDKSAAINKKIAAVQAKIDAAKGDN